MTHARNKAGKTFMVSSELLFKHKFIQFTFGPWRPSDIITNSVLL